jgi:hypothetical protein
MVTLNLKREILCDEIYPTFRWQSKNWLIAHNKQINFDMFPDYERKKTRFCF